MKLYGSYDVPLEIDKEGISISIKKEEEVYRYKRDYFDEKMEKVLLINKSKILIHPVEPLNKPREITSNFFMEFENTFVIEPQAIKKIYLKFPIEIGIFISGKKDIEIIDILTLVPQKFALYGDPRNGVICRYWKTEVFSSLPVVNPIQEGVMELIVRNNTHRWIELNKAVFNAYGMKIYFNDNLVSMKANIKILGEEMAETYFIQSPIKTGMKKSLELYTVRKLSVQSTRFVMEWGI